eukprot:5737424-Pleurochrysis_carterae.AAC.1
MKEDRKTEWEVLRRWHSAYSESESVRIGEVYRIGARLRYGGAPCFGWKEMWALFDSRAPGGSQHQQADSSFEQADEPSHRLDHESSRALR